MQAASGGGAAGGGAGAAAPGGGLAGATANPSWGAPLGMRVSPDRGA
jgi:hypothetical protein